VLLNNKFGVAIGICNQLSLGWGYQRTKKKENKEKSWKIH